MNAIKAIRSYIEVDPTSESSVVLSQFVIALVEESQFSLARLYATDYRAFELALELLSDWRLDRYYAARVRLYDVALQVQSVGDGSGSTLR